MSVIDSRDKGKRIISQPWAIIRPILRSPVADILSDKQYAKALYYANFGKKLDLNNPVTYNQKLMWRKLYDHNPIYPTMVDKFAVREYVREVIGGQYLIPLIEAWDSFDEIDFYKLPNQFVIQTNFGCGHIWICKDKKSADIEIWHKQFDEWMAIKDFGWESGEWQYAEMPHKLVITKYLDSLGALSVTDYKFHCFHGQVYGCLVVYDRGIKSTYGIQLDHYDTDWNLTEEILDSWHPQRREIEKPKSYDRMLEVARTLSADFPYCRVDLYDVDGHVLFGELTFTPHGNVLNYYTDEALVKMLDFYNHAK